MMRCATAPNAPSGGVQCVENTGTLAEHAASRQTAPPTTQSSPPRFTYIGAAANPCRAANAVPFRSPVMSLKPRTLLTFDGLPQFQASCTANATIDRSSRILPSSACGSPIPHALSGCDRSVQLIVLLVQFVVVNPAMPIPERMFQVATLKVPVGVVSTSGVFARAGSVGEPPQARIRIVEAIAAATATAILLRRMLQRLIYEVYAPTSVLGPRCSHHSDGLARRSTLRDRQLRRGNGKR